jgi:FtsH-binding integral membrane protein
MANISRDVGSRADIHNGLLRSSYMAEYETVRRAGVGARPSAQIDAGLRAHMNKVYGLMSAGMFITGIIAFFVGNNDAMLAAIFGSALKWVVIFAPLAVVFGLSAGINRLSENAARGVFFLFSALMGLSLSSIFAVYTGISIATTFFTTGAAFAALSLYGYTTKRDLGPIGSFLMMGLFGIILAMVVNIFLGSPAVAFAVNILGILIFAGLTAYDTQAIKNEYVVHAQHGEAEWLGKSAIMGALRLYLDFLNMFMFLLQFMGNRN